MTNYTAIPTVPTAEDLNPALVLVVNALKENVELLTGTRGEAGNVSMAVPRGLITVQQISSTYFQGLSAKGEGYTISGSDVASLADFARLISDVDKIAADLIALRNAVNALIRETKGS